MVRKRQFVIKHNNLGICGTPTPGNISCCWRVTGWSMGITQRRSVEADPTDSDTTDNMLARR